MKLSDEISNWIKMQVKEAKAEGVVVGLSGGIDSAVVAVLARNALKDKVLGLIMPCQSKPVDEEYARLLADRIGLKTQHLNLTIVYQALCQILPPTQSQLAIANLKPRLRMISLYYFANQLNYLVAGTGNRSEIMIGYFTKYGDGGVDILPIGGLLKTEVRQLAQELDIPSEIIERVPTAGLWPGQTDEGEIGISYCDLDKFFQGESVCLSSELLARIEGLIKVSTHKRHLPPIFEKASPPS